ncbi:MAG: tyrosine-type recombinase/integrase [Bacteroidota bacterium]
MHQDTFIRFLEKERRASPHTIDAYRTDLQQFVQFTQASYEVEDLTTVEGWQIRAWIVALLAEGKVPRTIQRKLATLKSFYKYFLEKGLIEKNPMQKVIAPKVGKRLPSFVQENQMLDLFDGEKVEFKNTYSDQRNRLILELFYMTGIRRSELIQLREQDIDFANDMLRIMGKGGKQRIVPLVLGLPDLIKRFLELKKETFPTSEHPEVFLTDKGKPLYPKLVYNIVHRNLSKITTIEQRSPHVIRHSFATHLSDHGAELNDIKELLGHSNLSATQIYTHNSIEKLKRAYQQAHPKANKKE